MDAADRERLASVTADVTRWAARARELLGLRESIRAAGEQARAELAERTVAVRDGDEPHWRVLPLQVEDGALLTRIGRLEELPHLEPTLRHGLEALGTSIPLALDQARHATGLRRFFSGAARRQAVDEQAAYLLRFHDWGLAVGLAELITGHLARLTDQRTWGPDNALEPAIGLRDTMNAAGSLRLIDATAAAGLPSAVAVIARTEAREQELQQQARALGGHVRAARSDAVLAAMPVSRLREATRDRLVIGPLIEAGLTSVSDVLAHEERLEELPGIGETLARRLVGAARTLRQTTFEATPLRIDAQGQDGLTARLLRSVTEWDEVRRTLVDPRARTLAAGMGALAAVLTPHTTHLLVGDEGPAGEGSAASGALEGALPGELASRERLDLPTALSRVVALGRSLAAHPGLATAPTRVRTPARPDPWVDFLARPAHYFALLSQLGLQPEDEERTHGDLPGEIVAAVRALELDSTHLTASLRGYQAFGARFALVQRKVVIGDEMGLGKTIEALAVLAHRHAAGDRHFLVVCPASIVTSWMREITSKTTLPAHRVHDDDRAEAALAWAASGGVAVTTYQTLRWLMQHWPADVTVDVAIVDEAHYVKNPQARRSARVRRLVETAPIALLLTGTPMENRLEEFATLAGYLRPDLTVDAATQSATEFRRRVAPVYLRRNQEDVLTELPELVEVDEWMPFSRGDHAAYRQAVAEGHFAGMRQAAMLSPDAEKLERLVDLVTEAAERGRRVLVFSYFRAVLDRVAASLPGEVFGPLTGSVPAAERQEIVDAFSSAPQGAVLVAQIEAGGVGLNIQAATVVIICEPQLKPTTEWQAIARAHRMGQLATVQVHRLLSEEGVDRRITELLAHKQGLFEEFARVSETAESAPEAFDVSEADLARQVVAEERTRLFPTGTGATRAGSIGGEAIGAGAIGAGVGAVGEDAASPAPYPTGATYHLAPAEVALESQDGLPRLVPTHEPSSLSDE